MKFWPGFARRLSVQPIVGSGKRIRFSPGCSTVYCGPRKSKSARHVCLPESGIFAKKPVTATLEDSAAFFFGGITVLNFLNKAKIHAGQRLLAYDASGSVGVFAVQMPKHFGAHVTVVCSTANLNFVQWLGGRGGRLHQGRNFPAGAASMT